jgi:hypothetical protein
MPLEMSSFEVEFRDLWTYDGGNTQTRLPLSQLSDTGGHIHGLLNIKVNGQELPYLGYFGRDDVCFNEWVSELKSALEELKRAPHSSYTYDEGEQGQPAFLFERDAGTAFVSVVASQLSDGANDPGWQRIQFSFSDFERSVEQFLVRLRKHIASESAQYGDKWWALVTKRAA